MRTVTVVSKHGCQLCEQVIKVLSSLSSRYHLDLEVLDIQDDPKLHDEYWLTIPVVKIDGKDVFDGRDMTIGADYAKKLEQLVGE